MWKGKRVALGIFILPSHSRSRFSKRKKLSIRRKMTNKGFQKLGENCYARKSRVKVAKKFFNDRKIRLLILIKFLDREQF